MAVCFNPTPTTPEDSEACSGVRATVLEMCDLGSACQLLIGLPASGHALSNPFFIL